VAPVSGGPSLDRSTEPLTVVNRPARLSATLAISAAVGGTLLAGTASGAGLAVGLLGVLALAVGVGVGSATAVGFGAAGTFLAVVAAGLAGGSVPVVVGGTLGAVLTWDLGEHAVTLGEQVGANVPTWSGELGHALSSVAVGGAAAVGVVVVYRTATAGLSTGALVVLAIAAVLLMAALRH
jgi:hypothetical protein